MLSPSRGGRVGLCGRGHSHVCVFCSEDGRREGGGGGGGGGVIMRGENHCANPMRLRCWGTLWTENRLVFMRREQRLLLLHATSVPTTMRVLR